MWGGPLWSPGGGGCERVPPQVSTGNRTRATIGTYPSCQRCCAASAAHSGKTKGARPSLPLLTTLAPTDVDELFVRLMSIGRPILKQARRQAFSWRRADQHWSRWECGRACWYRRHWPGDNNTPPP